MGQFLVDINTLTVRWEIRWGDHGEERTVLQPFDLIAVPPGVTRQFINLSDANAHVLVIIQGKKGEFDDVGRVPETAEAIKQKFGEAMLQKLLDEGWRFTLDAYAPQAARIAVRAIGSIGHTLTVLVDTIAAPSRRLDRVYAHNEILTRL